MKKTLDVNGLQNKEKCIQELLKSMTAIRRLEGINISSDNKLEFTFSDQKDDHAKAFAKQFSKKKFESFELAIFEFRKQTPKFDQGKGYKIEAVIEYEKEWIVVFNREQ